MATLCYTQVNNISPATVFEGNTLLVIGVPGFLTGSGTLNTTATQGAAHHQGPLDSRIDYRGGTVNPGQGASLSATFNATSVGLKGVYWYNAPNSFIRDPSPVPCQMKYSVAGAEYEITACNHGDGTFIGALNLLFLANVQLMDVPLAQSLLLGGGVKATLVPVQAQVTQATHGAHWDNGMFKLPEKSRLRVRVTPSASYTGQLVAAAAMRTTERNGDPFPGTQVVLLGSP